MSASNPLRPLAGLKQALRQCRAERQQRRNYAEVYPSLQTRYPLPPPGFRTSVTTKQNSTSPPVHFQYPTLTAPGPEAGMKPIRVLPPPRSAKKLCPDPIAAVTASQLAVLDATGARTRLFSKENPRARASGRHPACAATQRRSLLRRVPQHPPPGHRHRHSAPQPAHACWR